MTGGVRTSTTGILSEDKAGQRAALLRRMKHALGTTAIYPSDSDGEQPDVVLVHEHLAQRFAARIKELYGVVPGSQEFAAEQSYLQPPEHQTDVVHVIKGVIEAETGAIEHYNRIIEFCEGKDPVTQDMVIDILRDEEGHRRLFEGFLREYKAEGLA